MHVMVHCKSETNLLHILEKIGVFAISFTSLILDEHYSETADCSMHRRKEGKAVYIVPAT